LLSNSGIFRDRSARKEAFKQPHLREPLEQPGNEVQGLRESSRARIERSDLQIGLG